MVLNILQWNARGLIGKMEGDEVSVDTPGGTVVYEIVKVHHK